MYSYEILCCFFVLQIGGALSVQLLFARPCMTPNNEYVECYPLEKCPKLLEAQASQHPVNLQFLEQSRCDEKSYCCGPSSNYTQLPVITTTLVVNTKPTVTTTPKIPNKNEFYYATRREWLFAHRTFCGYQHSDEYEGDKSNTTKISEFPWLAAIYARNGDEDVMACVGSIIGAKYVLTQAYCVMNHNLVSVHLGEYDVSTDEDCVQEAYCHKECSEPVQRISINKTIAHPEYSKGDLDHDIALIRVNKKITTNDYVRPICLPFSPGTTFAKIKDDVRSSGWGSKHKVFATPPTIKKKISGKLTELEKCAAAFVNEKATINNGKYLCVSLNAVSDFGCRGDSGRPLVYSYENQWHQEGIATQLTNCEGHSTEVYMKVVDYLDWILQNIEQ